VQIQLIVAFGLIAVAIISAIGGVLVAKVSKTEKHAKESLAQVKNSHKTNLRDDLDGGFSGLGAQVAELAETLGGLVETVSEVKRDQGGMKSELRGIRRDQTVDRGVAAADREQATHDREQAARDREHIRVLEKTLTPAQLRELRQPQKGES